MIARAIDLATPRPEGHKLDRSGKPLICAKGIWKIFGPHAERIVGTADADLPRGELRAKTGCVAAVRDVSIEVWPGEVFVVMGLSGSGKSTLVRTLIRLIEPTAGTIEIDGQDVTAADPRRAARAAPAHRLDGLPALRPARAPPRDRQRRLRARGAGRAEGRAARPRAPRCSASSGSRTAANQFPDQLSGGMQQRVGLARAFAVDPKVMLFDEPFSALDPLIRRDMQDEVCRLQHETGQDDGLHHPRPARGAAARRPDRDHARRRVRAGRHAGGARRLAGRRLRRELRPRRPAQPRADAALDHARPSRPSEPTDGAEARRDDDRQRRRAGARRERDARLRRRGRDGSSASSTAKPCSRRSPARRRLTWPPSPPRVAASAPAVVDTGPGGAAGSSRSRGDRRR